MTSKAPHPRVVLSIPTPAVGMLVPGSVLVVGVPCAKAGHLLVVVGTRVVGDGLSSSKHRQEHHHGDPKEESQQGGMHGVCGGWLGRFAPLAIQGSEAERPRMIPPS